MKTIFKKLSLLGVMVFASIACTIITGVNASAQGNNGSLILSVNGTQVYEGYNLAQDTEKKLMEIEKKAEEELQKDVNEINTLVREVTDLERKLTDTDSPLQGNKDKIQKELEEKMKKGREKQLAFQNKKQELGQDFQSKRQQMLDARTKEFQEAVSTLAKQKNADHVLNSSGLVAVLYSKPELDITKDVINLLNKTHPVAATPSTVKK